MPVIVPAYTGDLMPKAALRNIGIDAGPRHEGARRPAQIVQGPVRHRLAPRLGAEHGDGTVEFALGLAETRERYGAFRGREQEPRILFRRAYEGAGRRAQWNGHIDLGLVPL